ncbi:2-hydroxycarboxylate transporter family protein [Kineococcus sp. SYSU DK001]|uniref:2-hydroxycarboxylate transporter family protein n=1 Tax=Kineococcus sp. SYSU DK001 TaxID=3383122 RepID=UPI003D7E91BB
MSAAPESQHSTILTADQNATSPGVSPSAEATPPARWRTVAGIPLGYYALFLAVLLTAAVTGNLPPTIVAGFATTLLVGGLFAWIGGLVPVLRDYGLPTVLCTFVPAVLLFAGVVPDDLATVVSGFTDTQGFLDFFVVSVITGCILGMPRTLLVKAGPRFAVPLLGCLAATFVLVGLLGIVTGFGAAEAVMFVAAPIMAGGLGLGAVPMADMYAARTGGQAGDYFGDLLSAVVLANVLCILIAGFYGGLSRGRRKQWFAGFNGHGQLLRVKGTADDLTAPSPVTGSRFSLLAQGIVVVGVLALAGTTLGAYATFLHPYAWTIVVAALVKVFGLLPQRLEEATSQWSDLMTTAFVPALLVGVSLTYIDIADVLQSLSNPAFLVLTAATVVVATATSGFLGWLVRFHFVEAAITPGLVMADTGGSGDVSVLSAANRMHLMPFAALTNRVGGAVVLFLTSLLVPLLAR